MSEAGKEIGRLGKGKRAREADNSEQRNFSPVRNMYDIK